MNDYIRREDAIKEIESYYKKSITDGRGIQRAMTVGERTDVDICKQAIEKMPSADVVESDYKGKQLQAVYDHGYEDGYAVGVKVGEHRHTVEPKQGEWIEGRCSICGEHAPFWSMASNYYKSKYCHNCGSLMLNGMTMDEIFGKTESTVSKTDTDNAKYSCEAEQTDCPWG